MQLTTSILSNGVKMGTYTTNYNLFMPTVGETGWGDLVNGNFSTIDSTMKSLSNRITAVENEVNGALSCTSVTTTGKVTANGGLSTKALTATTGTFSGAVTGTSATFSGNVKASNITSLGYIPYTLYLVNSSTQSTFAGTYYHSGVPNTGSTRVSGGSYVEINLNSSVNVPDNTSKTIKSICNMNSYAPAIINNIKVVSGSWGNPILKTNVSNITATISGINGTITNNGLTITYAQALQILSGLNTITLRNSQTGSSYQSSYVSIKFSNTSSSDQFCFKSPNGCYD